MNPKRQRQPPSKTTILVTGMAIGTVTINGAIVILVGMEMIVVKRFVMGMDISMNQPAIVNMVGVERIARRKIAVAIMVMA